MGLMSWAMKGISMERRAKASEPIAVVLEQPEVPMPQYTPEKPTEFQHASNILFGEQIASPYAQAPNPYPSVQSTYSPGSYTAPTFGNIFDGNTLGNRSILVITPRNNADVTSIVTHLRTEAVIVTLEDLPVDFAQRRLDFLSGVVCAFNGTIKPLDANKYILTPSGVGVKN